MLVLPCFVERDEPVVDLLLLVIEMVFCLNISEEVLESTDHVSVKTNPYHFDQNLIQVLHSSVALDVAVTDRCERSNDPVDRGAIQIPVAKQLDS